MKLEHDFRHGLWDNLGNDVKKGFSDIKKDFASGWGDTWKAGADAAGKSTFKFGNMIPGLGRTSENTQGGSGGKSETEKNSINTSNLAGASGGLGQAKVINVKIDVLQKNEIPGGDGKDVLQKSGMAIEELIRTLNNLSYSQSGTM